MSKEVTAHAADEIPDPGLNRRDLVAAVATGAAASATLASTALAQQPAGEIAVATAADYERDPTRWGSPAVAALFPGFKHLDMRTSGAVIRLRHGGSGPPLLLLHGNPQNHVCWHKVAARLAERYHVVLPDLRGYGNFRCPTLGRTTSTTRSAPWRRTWWR